MNDVEYFEKALDMEPWKIMVYGVEELREPCKKYENNPYKDVLRKLNDPYDARMLYFSAYVPIVENGGDPTELAKNFARAAVCLTAESTKYNYMVSVLMYLIYDSVENKDRFVKTIEIFRNVDWGKVKEFLDTVPPQFTREAYWLNFAIHNGVKRFEKEFREKLGKFDPEFLEGLKYIVKAPIEFFKYFGVDDELARMLHSYNADALDVDKFIEKIKDKASMSPCCFCPCCGPVGAPYNDEGNFDEDGDPVDVIMDVLGKYMKMSKEDKDRLREAIIQLVD